MNKFYRIAIAFLDEAIPEATHFVCANNIREADDKAIRLLSVFSVDAVSRLTVSLFNSDELPVSECEEP